MTTKHPILKNILSIGSARALSLLFPLLVLPYLINTIGVEHYGNIIFALAFVAYFNTLVDFSFNITAVRQISKNNGDLHEITNITNEVISTKLFLLLFALVIGSILIFTIPTFHSNFSIFLIIFSTLIGYALSPEWFFIGMEKMEYIAILMISFKILHAVSIFLFINDANDSWIYALILSAEKFMIAITSLVIVRWKFNIRRIYVSFTQIKKQLRKNSALFVNQLLPNLYNNTTTLLLGFFAGPAITGSYGILRKVTNLGESILKIVSNVFFPAINRDFNNRKVFRKLQWSLTIILIIFIGALSPLLPWLFEEMDQTITLPLMIMAFGIVGLTLYDIYGYNFFLVNRQDKKVLINTLVFSILGFAAAFPAIYFGGLIGATLVVAGTRIAIGVRLFILFKIAKS